MAKHTIVRYVLINGDVWVYLDNDNFRVATAAEVKKIIAADPDFALQISLQDANDDPDAGDGNPPSDGL